MNPLPEQWRILVPVALGGLAVWMLLPRSGKRSWMVASLLGLASLILMLATFRPPHVALARDILFYVCAVGAAGSGVMMVTDRNPVYAALWFALATLATCGIFLLNSAPFLAAATVVVYAGAIVVTFVFVIMLAQQSGVSSYDRRAFQPTLATLGSFLLLGSLLFALGEWGARGADETAGQFLRPPATVVANPLSKPVEGDLGSLHSVGRSLFGDYLYEVELAGTALLIATIGTIALSPRKAQGHL